MIALALALAVQGHWTGPHTEEYKGPGYFCGGGYAIHLAKGDRALILPQSAAGREVNVWSSAPPERGPVVIRYGGTAVTQQGGGNQISYTVSDQTDFGLHLTSDYFRGFKRDGLFFTKANFSSTVENRVSCLAAYSY